MYTVIEHFTDLQDNRFEYNPGDAFPRKGLEVKAERIEELSTDKNKRRRPLIKLVEEVKETMLESKEPVIEEKPKKTTRKRTKKSAD